ncbi:MAG: hypothetical protein ACE5G0_03750 [Rhodothermales bacterium]
MSLFLLRREEMPQWNLEARALRSFPEARTGRHAGFSHALILRGFGRQARRT